MKSERQLFGVMHRGHLFAVIEATDADEARDRINMVRNAPAYIPQECDVQPFGPHMWLRTPVFYEAHFDAMEDDVAQYLEDSAAQYP